MSRVVVPSHAGIAGARDSTRRRAVYFVSGSTGITAETLGSALLANFPSAWTATRLWWRRRSTSATLRC